MRAFLQLLWRGLRLRRRTFAVSLALGALAAILPWLPGLAAPRPDELRGSAALAAAALWSLLVAVVEGLGWLATDLREGRLGFDFRLPASGTAIWAARLAASAAAIAGAVLLVLGPAIAFGADLALLREGLAMSVASATGARFDAPGVAWATLLALAFVGGHVLGLATASRDAWLALDLSAIALLKLLTLAAVVPLAALLASRATASLLLAVGAAAALAGLIASWRQLVAGRTEPARAHRAFSIPFAALLLLPAIAAIGWSRSYRDARLEELYPTFLAGGELGERWIALGGLVEGRSDLRFRFLVRPDDATVIPLGPTQLVGEEGDRVRISADRSTLAWLDVRFARGGVASAALETLTTEAARPVPAATAVAWPRLPADWGLSPGGDRVASLWRPTGASSARVEVEPVAGGSAPRRAALPDCPAPLALRFVDELRLLVYCGQLTATGLESVTSWEVPLDGGEPRPTPAVGYPAGAAAEPSAYPKLASSPRRYRLRDAGAAGDQRWLLWLGEGLEGEVGLETPESLGDRPRLLDLLALPDGGWLVLAAGDRGLALALFDSAQRAVRSWPLPEAKESVFVGTDRADRAVYVRSSRVVPELGVDLLRVDLRDGDVTAIGRDLRTPRTIRGNRFATLYLDASGRLLRLDLESGELRPLTGNG